MSTTWGCIVIGYFLAIKSIRIHTSEIVILSVGKLNPFCCTTHWWCCLVLKNTSVIVHSIQEKRYIIKQALWYLTGNDIVILSVGKLNPFCCTTHWWCCLVLKNTSVIVHSIQGKRYIIKQALWYLTGNDIAKTTCKVEIHYVNLIANQTLFYFAGTFCIFGSSVIKITKKIVACSFQSH
jgi:uncharacterized membrane protein